MTNHREIDALLGRVARGDREAFARVYDLTSSAIYGLLLGMLRRPAAAEEVAQDVYLEVWKKAGSFDAARGSGMTWLSLLARSRAVDRLRSERSYAGAVDRAENALSADELLGETRPDPEEAASLGQRRQLVRGALREMSTEQRTAVVLSFFGGFSHSEIAERQGIPLGTVKSRIRSGLLKVESRLENVLGREV